MPRNPFASLGTSRLDLGGGDWVEVKDELAFGEQQALNYANWKLVQGQGVIIDYGAYDLKKLEYYLVDWSFRDAAGKPVSVTPETIQALAYAVAQEIIAALNAHLSALAEGEAAPDPNPPAAASRGRRKAPAA